MPTVDKCFFWKSSHLRLWHDVFGTLLHWHGQGMDANQLRRFHRPCCVGTGCHGGPYESSAGAAASGSGPCMAHSNACFRVWFCNLFHGESSWQNTYKPISYCTLYQQAKYNILYIVYTHTYIYYVLVALFFFNHTYYVHSIFSCKVKDILHTYILACYNSSPWKLRT